MLRSLTTTHSSVMSFETSRGSEVAVLGYYEMISIAFPFTSTCFDTSEQFFTNYIFPILFATSIP